MNGRAKVGVVGAGYLAALAAGFGASWLYNLRMAAMPYDTSGGMYAEGEALSGLVAFLAVALIPTLMGLWYLRRNRVVWLTVSLAALAWATAGLVAVLITFATRGAGHNPVLLLLELLALSQLLGVPFWIVGFALLAVLAPTPRSRRTLFVAIGIELVIAVLAGIHWFVPGARF